MAEYNIYKGNVMKRIFLLILTVIIFSCGNQSDDSFSSDFLLEHTGWLSIPLNDSMSVPSWDSENSFWTAYKYKNQILTRMDLEGNVLDEITLYIYPDAPSEIIDPYVSSDGSTIVFAAEADSSASSDVFRIKIGTVDHSMFTFDGVENRRLPNLSDLHNTSPVYPWTDKMGYLGTQLDYNTMTAAQSYYIYDFITGNTQSFLLGIYEFDNDGNVLRGDYYYNPDVYADPDDPDSINMIMFCVRLETDSGTEPVYTVKMFGADGSAQYDGSADYQFENIGGLRWMDENSVLMTVEEEGIWKIISGDNTAERHEYYSAENGTFAMNGLSLSPLKTRCLTQLFNGEDENKSEILVVNLF
ncbi:hypothetical protein DV872_10345 [Oceanispirochaeta sp. M1]|nr:hypothetical protein DV872_10345 [Oceanispirochaeta sp. M1]